MPPIEDWEEINGDISNLYGMVRDLNRKQDTHALALGMIVRTLNDRWPGMRRIICDDMNEAIAEIDRRFALMKESSTPEMIEDHDEEIEVLTKMVFDLERDA